MSYIPQFTNADLVALLHKNGVIRGSDLERLSPENQNMILQGVYEMWKEFPPALTGAGLRLTSKPDYKVRGRAAFAAYQPGIRDITYGEGDYGLGVKPPTPVLFSAHSITHHEVSHFIWIDYFNSWARQKVRESMRTVETNPWVAWPEEDGRVVAAIVAHTESEYAASMGTELYAVGMQRVASGYVDDLSLSMHKATKFMAGPDATHNLQDATLASSRDPELAVAISPVNIGFRWESSEPVPTEWLENSATYVRFVSPKGNDVLLRRSARELRIWQGRMISIQAVGKESPQIALETPLSGSAFDHRLDGYSATEIIRVTGVGKSSPLQMIDATEGRVTYLVQDTESAIYLSDAKRNAISVGGKAPNGLIQLSENHSHPFGPRAAFARPFAEAIRFRSDRAEGSRSWFLRNNGVLFNFQTGEEYPGEVPEEFGHANSRIKLNSGGAIEFDQPTGLTLVERPPISRAAMFAISRGTAFANLPEFDVPIKRHRPNIVVPTPRYASSGVRTVEL